MAIEEREVLDVMQLKNIVQSLESRDAEINELKAENTRLKNQQKDLSGMLEKYSEFVKIIDDPPAKHLIVTLRNTEDLQRFFIRVKKDFGVDAGADNSQAIKKSEQIINFLFWWVVSDSTRWSNMVRLYKEAIR